MKTLSLPVHASYEEKINLLHTFKHVKEELLPFSSFLKTLDGEKTYLFTALAFLKQLKVISQGVFFPEERVAKPFFFDLLELEKTYSSLGGLIGYHETFIKLQKKDSNEEEKTVLFPPFLTRKDLSSKDMRKAIELLESTVEIYPVGGSGDRLGFKDEKGNPLPVALLNFGGKTLIERLFDDLSAKEYLFFKLFGKKISIPVFLMTSHGNNNHKHLETFLHLKENFKREEKSLSLVPQPLVPVISKEGAWLVEAPYKLILKPSGHGALWQLLKETKALDTYQNAGKKYAFVRQINNPLAGEDETLFELLAAVFHEHKPFCFLACEQKKEAAEGVLALVQEGKDYYLSNIEYTSKSCAKLKDFPSNINLLCFEIEPMKGIIEKHPLPGLLVNLKSTFRTLDEEGKWQEKLGGRLETTMQNISDALISQEKSEVPSCILKVERKKTLSVTKKRPQGHNLFETPEGAYKDLLSIHRDLLVEKCHFSVPSFEIHENPSITFLYHPALGPSWKIISQKLREGKIAKRSFLYLDIAELDCKNLVLDGSLIIKATHPFGEEKAFSPGRCHLENVSFINKGVDKNLFVNYLEDQIHHLECAKIILEEDAEFFAQNVSFKGNFSLTVPKKTRAIAEKKGDVVTICYVALDSPTWTWHYAFDENDEIKLTHRTL